MPRKTSTRQTRRVSKPKPLAATPAPKNETPLASVPTAAPPASLPIEQSLMAPAVTFAPGVQPAPASIVVAPPVAPANPVVEALTDGATSAAPEELRLGQVECLLHRMPVGEVHLYLEAFEDRIATLQNSQAIIEMQPQVLATEGRCAPIYFTEDEDGDPEFMIAGIETFAAAMNVGLECVFVVTVAPGDVAALQGHLNWMLNQPTVSSEDDLFARVASYHR